MKCCFSSVDENNYSRISVTIPPLSYCKYTAVTCTSLVTNCNIRVLNKKDYIVVTVGEVPPFIIYFDDYTNLNVESFAEILNDELQKRSIPLNVIIDNCNRYIFTSDYPFIINDISYNVKLLLGLYTKNDKDIAYGVLSSIMASTNEDYKYYLQIQSVGMFLSTPLLYLISNISDPSLRNATDNITSIQSCNTILRINNSFSPNIPIIANGDGSSSIIPSGCVSGAIFILVDANMKEIDLLNPMYITLTLTPVGNYDND